MTRSEEMLAQLDGYISRSMQDWRIPGLAVAIVKDDATVLERGYGVCGIATPQAVNEHTIFAIGSNTKAFTVTALGLLVQAGKIAWDDPVIKYLPGFQMFDPYVTREITIRDLLCHRSGLSTWGGDLLAYGSSFTRDEVVDRVRFVPPAFSFRSGFGYSNFMFITAGQIIPAVTGLSWDDFVKQRLFEPLGMTRTTTSIHNLEGIPNVAAPHDDIGGSICALPYRNVDNIGPSGGINSTVHDLTHWLRLQLSNGTYADQTIVTEAIIEETRTPHTPIRIPPAGRKLIPTRHFYAYGLGWFLMDYQGRLVVSHGGAVDGMLSRVVLVPEAQLGLVILTNHLSHNFDLALALHVADAYLDAPSTAWNQRCLDQFRDSTVQHVEQKKKVLEARKSAGPTLALHDYAGDYLSPTCGAATICERDGKMILQLAIHPAITGELEHWHFDTFLCKWTDPVFDQSLIPFILDGQGVITEFRLKVREDLIDPLEHIFKRVPESNAS